MFTQKSRKWEAGANGQFSRGYLVGLVLIAALLAGCGGGTSGNATVAGDSVVVENPSDTVPDPSAGTDFAGEAVLAVAAGFSVDLPPGALGSATFTRDEARSQSVEYPADGQGVTLQATDAGGLTWTLEVPANALVERQTLRMTPLTGISAGTPSALASGILLEPDGLQFFSAATLRVTGPGAEKFRLILTGNQDGSGLEFAAVTAATEGAAAQILHFSSWYAPFDGSTQGYRIAADADYESARKAALELLKKPISVPPAPSVKYNCMGTAAYKDPEAMLKEYVKQVNSPEEGVIARLIAAGSTRSLLGADADDSMALAARVQWRVVRKVNLLIRTYEPQPEKFAAVSRAFLRAASGSAQLGGDPPPLAVLIPWAEKVRDHYLDELRTRHDYSVMPALIPLDREASLLGGQGKFEEIRKAMTFKVTFDTTATAQGDGAGDMVFVLHGDILARREINDKWGGTGTGQYTSFQAPEGVQMLLPNGFPVTISLANVDACVNKSVDVFVDRFGADTETFVAEGHALPVEGIVKRLGFGLFNDAYVPQTANFTFNMPLHNEQAEAAGQLLLRQEGGVRMDYDLKVVHTPE